MDHARSLDQSRGSSQRFLSDRSQQRKELPFPVRLCIRVNSHSPFDAAHRQQIFSSPLPADRELQFFGLPNHFRIGMGVDHEMVREGLQRIGRALKTA